MPDKLLEPATPFSRVEITEIEQSIGRLLPKDYLEFVSTYGGAFAGGAIDGNPELPILAFFGADAKTGIISKLRTYQDLHAESILPIADCELGNLYVLDRENAVHYLNYYGGKTTAHRVASSFDEFLARVIMEDN